MDYVRTFFIGVDPVAVQDCFFNWLDGLCREPGVPVPVIRSQGRSPEGGYPAPWANREPEHPIALRVVVQSEA